jgi:hypothetical protein
VGWLGFALKVIAKALDIREAATYVKNEAVLDAHPVFSGARTLL